MGGNQIAQLYGDYRAGRLDYRGFVRQASHVGGGALGALSGATGGAVAGMWLGTFGGPVAWFTIPAGGFVGGAIGGVIGYFAGSTIAGTAADWYLTSLDSESQRQLGEKLFVLSSPEFDQLHERAASDGRARPVRSGGRWPALLPKSNGPNATTS